MDKKSLEGLSVEQMVEWAKAVLAAREDGDSRDLVALLRSNSVVPLMARTYLGDLLEGKLKPVDRRGKANGRLSRKDAERVESWLADTRTYSAVASACIDQLADERQMEPNELRALINKRRSEDLTKIAEHVGLSENTVRQFGNARKASEWAEVFLGIRGVTVGDSDPFDAFPADLRGPMLNMTRAWLDCPALFPDLTE